MLDSTLLNEIQTFHLIHKKFRVQQRNQKWWYHISMLHRKLLRFVQKNAVDKKSARFLIEKLIPTVNRGLHNVFTQAAFITLGFALMACTAKIYTLLEPLVYQYNPNASQPITLLEQSISNDNEDLGEPIEISEKAPKISISGKPSKRKTKYSESKYKARSKKQVLSTIDKIFS